jgi:hypothetical protein
MVRSYSFGPNDFEELEKILGDKTRTRMIKWHSPNCGHCLAMKDDWEAMIDHEMLKDRDDIDLIEAEYGLADKINHEAGKIMVDPENPRGVPTIFMMTTGSHDLNEYDGDRSTKDMVDKLLKLVDKPDDRMQSGGKQRKLRKRRVSKKSKTRKLKSKKKQTKRRKQIKKKPKQKQTKRRR